MSHTKAGIEYVDVQRLVERFSLKPHKTSASACSYQSKWTRLDLHLGSRTARYNGRLLYLNGPVIPLAGGAWGLTRADAREVIDPLLRSQDHLKGKRLKVIVIDPGHGGEDPGTRTRSGSLLLEKTAALDVSQRLKTLLEQQGYTVHLTRRGDETLTLQDRPALATKLKADLFISIHFNNAAKTSSGGIETFAMTAANFYSTHDNAQKPPRPKAEPGNGSDVQNFLAAHDIQAALVRKTRGIDRGVKRARFKVLRLSTCPSVLLEAGFMSNAKEANKIRSTTHRQLIASAIAEGVKAYGDRIKKANP